MLINILICQLLSGLAVGMSAITTDEFSGMIRLFNNGSVLDSSESPLCDSEQKISLSSYNFRIKKCIDNNTRCMYPTAPLSQEAKMILHDGCSYRHECDHLNFATVAHDHYYNNRLHSLRIGYSCLGKDDRQYDLCEDRLETLTGRTMHLMTGKQSRQFSRCQCSLKGELDSLVAVTLKDIRLYSKVKAQRKCSKSVLKIDAKTFACNSSSNALGSVFNEVISLAVHNDSSIVSLDVKDDFDMVWLTLEAQGSVTVECRGKVKEIVTLKTTSNYGYVSKSDNDSAIYDTQNRTELNSIDIVIMCTCAVLLLCVVMAVTVNRMFRLKRTLLNASISEATAVAPMGTSDMKPIERPETTYAVINNTEMDDKNIQSEETVEKSEEDIDNSTWRITRLTEWLLSLFRHKPIESQPSGADLDETIKFDTEGLKTNQQPVECSIEAVTEESKLSDKCENTEYYHKGTPEVPVQECRQDGSVEAARGNYHIYAPLNHSLSKDSGMGTSENEVYNYTQFNKPVPQRDPTYNCLPIVRSSTSYNYMPNKFLTSRI